MLRLAPRAEELADDLRSIVPAMSVADEPMVRLLALQLARIEAANDWLAEHGLFRDAKGEPQPVLRALSTWENSAARLADRLGLTPTSRGRLGLDLTRARHEEELRQHIAETYGAAEEAVEA
jgi:phage terminase small subunit